MGGWTVVALALGAGLSLGAGGDETATVRIGVPSGRAAEASLELGDGVVALELPKGSVLPADLARESNGIVRAGRLLPGGSEGSVRIELTLAAGALDRVRWSEDAVSLTFRRRSGLSAATATTDARAYRLGADDKLQIAVAGHPELTQLAVVSANGYVTAPLVGEMKVSGSTLPEFTERLTEALARDFMVDPKVDVQILDYRSQWAVFTGEVKVPGRISLRGGTDLKQALAEVGGFGPEAGEDIEISRTAAGGTTTIRVDRGAYERGEQNPVLEHGDLVNVPRATFAFVNGEVRAPGRLRVERGLSLLKLLAMAGGPTEWANLKAVRILPEGNSADGRDYNVRDIEDGKAEDPAIHGGDVVIVRRRFL